MKSRALAAPLSLNENLASYLSYLNRALKANFAYKSSTFLGLFTGALSYGITVLVWRHVYAQGGPAHALSANEMFAYLALAFCLNYALTINIDQRVGQRIRLGLIATDLLKPLDFQLTQAVQALSDSLFNGFVGLGVLTVVYTVLGGAILPKNLNCLLLFLPSVFLAFVVQYSIVFFFIQGAFYTYSGYGLFASRIALHQTFSGLQAPLILYPPVLLAVGRWLPFQHIIFTPISIYMGRVEGAPALSLLGEQALWAAGLYLVGHFTLRKALGQLEIQGG
jgi:ABC-2 type transport system permease protein